MLALLLALFTELALSLFPTRGCHPLMPLNAGPVRQRLATTVFPTDAWDLALARTAACFLEKGMTEEQVVALLGETFGRMHMSSLGGFTVYPEYRLRLDFSYTGHGLLSARFMQVEARPNNELVYRYLQELPLQKGNN